MGVQVVPAFSVFQTPPEPAATYQVWRFKGWMTISLIRPDMRAGPMLRKARPERSSGERAGFFSTFAPDLASDFAAAGAAWAASGPAAANAAKTRRTGTTYFFILTSSSRRQDYQYPGHNDNSPDEAGAGP